MSHTDLLRDKVVVITGGGSGIGRELALFIAAHGGKVVVNDLGTSPSGEGADLSSAETVVNEIRAAGGEAVASGDDVSTWVTAQRIIAAAMDSYGRVDAVVNSAGVMRHAAFEQMPPEDFDLVLKTHLNGTFYVSRAAAPIFQAQNSGAYLHMSSTTGLIGTMGVANYGSAKAGIAGLSRLIAFDMKRYNVRSNCMAPSARSRQWERVNAFRQAEFAKTGANTDFRQFRSTQGTAAQIAPVAAFLLTDGARDITGQIIGVRGNEIYLYSQPRPIRSVHRSEGWTLESLEEQLAQSFRPSLTPLETYGEVFSLAHDLTSQQGKHRSMDSKRTAIVTGAARGMGLAIARRLGQGGHHVVLIDVLADEVETAAEALRAEGIGATGLPLDLGDEAQRAALPERLGARFESVAVLVNNAAISPKRDGRRIPAGEIPIDEWERVVQINLTAPFRLIQLCLPPMRARGWGRIVNIASRAGRSPGGVAGAHYVTTKTGILGMTRAFGKEIASDGVTVNAIAPGRIETPMSAGSPPEVLAGVLKTIPVGRFGTPEEVAALTSFLAGDEAGFITGATFDINGGVLMI